MPEIKTRDVVSGTIKTIDRSTIAGQRMKDAYVQAKSKAEHSVSSSESNSEEYASNQMENGTAVVIQEGIHHMDVLEQHMSRPHKQKPSLPPTAQQPHPTPDGVSPAEQSPPSQFSQKSCIRSKQTNAVKYPPQSKIKQPSATAKVEGIKGAPSAHKLPDKTIGKGERTIKAGEHIISTNDRTGHASIKTIHAASHTGHPSAIQSAKATQQTKIAIENTSSFANRLAESTEKAVRVILAGGQKLVTAMLSAGWVSVLVIILILMVGMLAGSSFGIFFSGEPNADGEDIRESIRELNVKYQAQIEHICASVQHDEMKLSGAMATWQEILSVYAVYATTNAENPQNVASMNDINKDILEYVFWEMTEVTYKTETQPEPESTETVPTEETTAPAKTILQIQVKRKSPTKMADVLRFDDFQKNQLDMLLDPSMSSMWLSLIYGIQSSDTMIVDVARSQIGNVGGMPYWSWYGFPSREGWCACFVSWCANECGYIDAGIFPKFAGPEWGVYWFKQHGQWLDRRAAPTPGMIIFFDWYKPENGGQDGVAEHVAIVDHVEDGIIYTIEGNSIGDSCRECTRTLGDFQIMGYGVPMY